MNGWDIFTYFSCVVLVVSAVGIFVFFLRDAGDIIHGIQRREEPEQEEEG